MAQLNLKKKLAVNVLIKQYFHQLMKAVTMSPGPIEYKLLIYG